MTNPILSSLTDEDRYFFQSRRYGYGGLWILALPSGKIILADPKRDPLAVIESIADLRRTLADYKHLADARVVITEERRERVVSAGRKRATETTELDAITIDL